MSVVRPDRNMQVTPESVEHREGLAETPPDELALLKQRIRAARALMPDAHAVHCRDCFQKGRDAALRAIEGADE